METKIRFVMVEPNGSGGLIHYAYQLCTALANEGMDVTLITGRNYELTDFPHNFKVDNMLDLWTLFESSSAHSVRENIFQRGWRQLRWATRRGLRAFRLVRAWLRLTSHLSALKPDIIQFSKINFPFESFFLARLHKRGLVLTQLCHEFELRENSGPFSALILKTYSDVYTHFSAMFFHARENRDRFLELFPFVPADSTHVIAHGNSDWLLNLKSDSAETLRARYGFRGDERVVLFFGLLAPSKGLDDLIDAFAIARQSCAAKLVIAGYPTKHIDMPELQARIERLNIQNDVVLDTRYIPLEQIKPLIELASVMVYPYLSSTQSGALQVAYTFGKPVIATRVGGLPEAVDDSQSGFLVPAHAPREMAEKIIALINDPQRAAEMGKYARHLSETRFNWQTIAKEMRPVYEKLVLAKPGSDSLL